MTLTQSDVSAVTDGRELATFTDAHGLIRNRNFYLQSRDVDDRQLLQILVANGVTSILNLYWHVVHPRLRRSCCQRASARANDLHQRPLHLGCSEMAARGGRSGAAGRRAETRRLRSDQDARDFSREAFHRLFVVARREGMKVIGHAPRNLGVEASSTSTWTPWPTARSSSTPTFSSACPTCPGRSRNAATVHGDRARRGSPRCRRDGEGRDLVDSEPRRRTR